MFLPPGLTNPRPNRPHLQGYVPFQIVAAGYVKFRQYFLYFGCLSWGVHGHT